MFRCFQHKQNTNCSWKTAEMIENAILLYFFLYFYSCECWMSFALKLRLLGEHTSEWTSFQHEPQHTAGVQFLSVFFFAGYTWSSFNSLDMRWYFFAFSPCLSSLLSRFPVPFCRLLFIFLSFESKWFSFLHREKVKQKWRTKGGHWTEYRVLMCVAQHKRREGLNCVINWWRFVGFHQMVNANDKSNKYPSSAFSRWMTHSQCTIIIMMSNPNERCAGNRSFLMWYWSSDHHNY